MSNGSFGSTRSYKPQFKITKYLEKLIQVEPAIAKQFVPSEEEFDESGEVDPLAEEDNLATSKSVHKYPNRLLVYTGNVCFANCRYCVRRNLIKKRESIITEKEVNQIVDYLNKNPLIDDVILSGGDSLILSNSQLKYILSSLKSVNSVKIIRIGTRAVITQPKRITKRLVNMLSKFNPVFCNIHVNHPAELTSEVKTVCDLLVDNGIVLGSQTVLLRNVNDDKEIMKELMKKLLTFRVKPYYIYGCDHVKGTKHFWVDDKVGIEIMKYLQREVSGLGVPKFVRDTKERKVILA